jgi:hypothetical protein
MIMHTIMQIMPLYARITKYGICLDMNYAPNYGGLCQELCFMPNYAQLRQLSLLLCPGKVHTKYIP